MCGIAGWVHTSAARVSPQIAEKMLDSIFHRGPDDDGKLFTSHGFLGMRRLSIIDVDQGKQPIGSQDNKIQVFQNGEIYNFLEIRERLEKQGYRFRTNSDTESIAHLFDCMGERAFAGLRGMFAISVWDEKEKSLYLARDPLGKKPLYYVDLGDSLVYGSEIKSIIHVPQVSREIDERSVSDYLTFGYVPNPNSIFKHIKKVPPGHFLKYKDGKIELTRFWDLEFEPKRVESEQVLEEELMEVLDEAVRLRLVSDVPWGACLSGGIDSSVMVSLMAKHLTQPVKTFSIGFDDSEFSELSSARILANHVGSEHHELIVKPDAAAMLDELVWYLDEPFADSSALPTYLVSKLAADHVKMVITGDGGDESFGGYSRYQRFMKQWKYRKLGAFAPVGQLLGDAVGGAFGYRLSWLSERFRMGFPDQYIAAVAISRPSEISSLTKTSNRFAPYSSLSGKFPSLKDTQVLDAMIAGDIRSYLVDDICVKVDRMSMACSIEARSPLLDHEVVKFAAKLPVSQKSGPLGGKHILKRIASQLIPEELLTKPKQGFAIPLKKWFKGPLYEMAYDNFSSQNFVERGVINHERARMMLEDHRNDKGDFSEQLWAVLSFELWCQKFL